MIRTNARASILVHDEDPAVTCAEHDGLHPPLRTAHIHYESASITFTTVADAERLAQACLAAANLLREKADPPADVVRIADVPVDVASRLAPYEGGAA